MIFVDDGSSDNTWEIISELSLLSPLVTGVKLAGNVGHQKALLAGLSITKADMVISIDADLQDDISVIEKMVDKYNNSGVDIVYGVRMDRSSDTVFKRKTAELFYKTMTALGVKQVPNHADFRLMSRKAVDALLEYKEQNIYLRGLVPMMGFKSEKVTYIRKERMAGESKYPLKKMISLALNGITSFSIFPLRVISYFGFLVAVISVFCALYVIYEKVMGGTVQGWASVMIAMFFMCGVQMLSIGIIGEYIGKIFIECKRRPPYFIDKVLYKSTNDR